MPTPQSTLRAAAALACAALLGASAVHAAPQKNVYIPALVAQSSTAGHYTSESPMYISFSLPLRDKATMESLIKSLYDPADPLYGKYISSAEFTRRFGPTKSDYNAVMAFAQSKGLTVVSTEPGRTLLTLSGASTKIESALGIRLNSYVAPDGHSYFAPNAAPTLPASISGKINGVLGLDTANPLKPNNHLIRNVGPLNPRPFRIATRSTTTGEDAGPSGVGTGLGQGLVPSDIKSIYNLNTTTLNGSGQTLGLFELDNYTGKDVYRYELDNNLRRVPLQNVYVLPNDPNFPTVRGAGTSEVILDIDMQIALAPGAAKEIVYIAPNDQAGVIACYQQIATDNLAKQISTSWGGDELGFGTLVATAEGQSFSQMATQGQSIYAASGDNGTYPTSRSTMNSVQDPASQPFMCSVGGTTLTVNAGETYASEKVWNNGGVGLGAGGGGVSTLQNIPSYQVNAATYTLAHSPTSGVSTTKRNVPDVSLNSDPNTGYLLYVSDPGAGAGYYIYGGTSAAAPLWAGFTALVNQNRARNSYASTLGFPNATLYPLAYSSATAFTGSYTSLFHDITVGNNSATPASSSLYPAVTGFDDATGLGTFQGLNLIQALSGSTP